MTEAPFYVWRRGDGYVGCTRFDPRPRHSGSEPINVFDILLVTPDWSDARARIESERVA